MEVMISASNLTTFAPTRLHTCRHLSHHIHFLATLAILQFLPPCEKLLTMKSKGLMPAKTKGKGDEGIHFPLLLFWFAVAALILNLPCHMIAVQTDNTSMLPRMFGCYLYFYYC